MRSSRRFALVLSLSLAAAAPVASAQPPETLDAAEIRLALKKLRVTGTALYVAAHPDDENTAFLAWLSRERLVRTAYLSVTRGDGGQNLIGSEKGDLIGLIRTQELLAARRIDGAEQLFTRAIDFGYSKSPEETLKIWGKDDVLADVVRAVRTLRPDVIVTRFPVTGEGGHGHHTSSAILAEEAFDAAADPARYPEQIREGLGPWRAKRLLWNAFRFGADAPRKEIPGGISVDLGAYNTLLGRSYSEIAAQSRSMHKSQGFGSAERRGTFLNDFAPRRGEPAAGDLFDGVDLTWNRVAGGAAVDTLLAEAERAFDPLSPSGVVPKLLEARAALAALKDEPIVAAKRREIDALVRSCLGLWVEAIAADETATPGGEVKVATLALVRAPVAATLERVDLAWSASPIPVGELKTNVPLRAEVVLRVPASARVSNPYWLEEKPAAGLYAVSNPSLVGRPESPAAAIASFHLRVAGRPFEIETPVVHRFTDPVKGEVYRPFLVAPDATVRLDEGLYLFGKGTPRPARLVVAAGRAEAAGTVRLLAPAGWKVEPSSFPFSLAKKRDEASFAFTITPPPGASSAVLTARLETTAGAAPARQVVRVDYPHIPAQTLHRPLEARLVRLDVAGAPLRVGYVMGSGDDGPDVLRQLGESVAVLSDEDLDGADLSRFDTIVLGVRAFNTRPRLAPARPRLFDWVSKGGTLVVQYNTTGELVADALGPYPFKLSRDRVTVEDAPVTLAEDPILAAPNRITSRDFEGWVQERGLYFPSEWGPEYRAPLTMADPGESPKKGSLLVARHGKGAFVYTGLSFFRQLPAGVPGAVRLFANLLSAGKRA